jgi:hypothetical protein
MPPVDVPRKFGNNNPVRKSEAGRARKSGNLGQYDTGLSRLAIQQGHPSIAEERTVGECARCLLIRHLPVTVARWRMITPFGLSGYLMIIGGICLFVPQRRAGRAWLPYAAALHFVNALVYAFIVPHPAGADLEAYQHALAVLPLITTLANAMSGGRHRRQAITPLPSRAGN